MKSFLSKLFGAQAIANIVGTAVMVSCIFAYIYYINPPMPNGEINAPYYTSDINKMITIETGVELTTAGDGFYVPTLSYEALTQCGIKIIKIDEANKAVIVEPSSFCTPDEILTVHVSDEGWILKYKFERYPIITR